MSSLILSAIGDAVITTGGDLPATRCIHVVPPRCYEMGQDYSREQYDNLLKQAYTSVLQRAAEIEARYVAIPILSSEIYHLAIALDALGL